MAIAFDASSSDWWTTWTTHTLSHTCSWSNRLLVVTILGNHNDVVTGVTYAGASMTRVSFVSNGSSDGIYMYYLLNPATGTNNIVATTSSSQTVLMQNASYTGVRQSSQPNVFNTWWYTTSTSLSTSVTTTDDNCWTIGIFRCNNNQTANWWTTFRAGIANSIQVGDSNWPKTPAGSTSLGTSWTWSTFAAQIIASFSPFVASNTNPAFFLNLL